MLKDMAWGHLMELKKKQETRLKSKVFSLERLCTLKLDFGPLSLKDRVKCGV